MRCAGGGGRLHVAYAADPGDLCTPTFAIGDPEAEPPAAQRYPAALPEPGDELTYGLLDGLRILDGSELAGPPVASDCSGGEPTVLLRVTADPALVLDGYLDQLDRLAKATGFTPEQTPPRVLGTDRGRTLTAVDRTTLGGGNACWAEMTTETDGDAWILLRACEA